MKLIEEISLNAWPSHKIELYDGWLIRFSHNYTHRTNSVQQVGASSIPVEEKVAYCEAMYANYHTPAIFKISPLLDPAFDRMLEERDYEIQMCIRDRNEIMRSIMDHAGLQTKARAVVFSLPVTDIAGMYLMNEMLEEA